MHRLRSLLIPSWVLILILLVLLVLISNLLKLQLHLLSPIDFSYYQNAAYNIAGGFGLNPYIPLRNTAIFNDHVDIIIIFLTAPFVKLFGYTPQVLMVFEWLWWVGLMGFTFLIMVRGALYRKTDLLLALSITIFSRSLLQGVEFPIHPATWSMLSTFLLFYFFRRQNFLGVVIMATLSCTFRESFPFMVLGLSGYYFLNREWKRFIVIFMVAILFLFLYFYLRPFMYGPTVDNGNYIIRTLLSDPIQFILLRLTQFTPPYKCFVVPLLLILLIVYCEVKSFKNFFHHSLFAVFCFIFPAFMIHFLGNYMVHHHTVPIVAPFLAIAFTSPNLFTLINYRKWIFALILILSIVTASSRYTNMVEVVIKAVREKDRIAERNIEMEKLKRWSDETLIPNGPSLIASGSVIPHLVSPGRAIFQFHDVTPRDRTFDYLLLAKEDDVNFYPISLSVAKVVLKNCLPYSTKTVINNRFWILLKGPFNDRCLGLTKIFPELSRLVPQ